jgi:inhibitor of KinA
VNLPAIKFVLNSVSLMNVFHPYTIFPLGDSAMTVDFGNVIDVETNKKVLRLFHHLKQKNNPYIIDLVPAYSSLTVYYDLVGVKQSRPAVETAFEAMAQIVEELSATVDIPEAGENRIVEVPVCYSPSFGPDLNHIAFEKNCPVKEVIRLHMETVYRVFMIGFLPGFAYMGEVDEKISVPRKKQPRHKVEAGSVGIAGRQTGIYPLRSPGGWQIIGRTPLKLFDVSLEHPVLFQPGDQVKFYSITEDEFAHYKSGHS